MALWRTGGRVTVDDPQHRSGTAQMTLALRYAVRSDVGLLREGNEDSAYAGPHLLAVADGMGGHAAGEVASAATITTIAPLDAEDPGPDLVGALADAVATANLRLQELIISDPATEGMGTTLTALLWADGYAALCHIGDSRAYLLREGRLVQITHDHTLVQSLVDEGKITEDDVATHPHRSLLLRALDGRTVAEPDLAPLETYPGDRFLLCSDGLSGVVTEQTLHQALASVRDPDKAALRLVELAIKGGGPDNITCIVADVLDTHASRVPPTWQPAFAGAAANGAPADMRPPARQSSPATRAMRLSRTAPQPVAPEEPPAGAWPTGPAGYRDGYTGSFEAQAFEPGGYGQPDGRRATGPNRIRDTAAFERPSGFPGDDDDQADLEAGDRGGRRGGHRAKHHRYDDDDDDDYAPRGKRRWPIVTASLGLLVLLIAGGGYGFWRYNQSQYYVGVDQDGYVAIFRGTDQSLAGISLSSLVQKSTLKASELRSTDQATLAQTITQGSVNDAQMLLDQLQTQVNQCKQQWQAVSAWPAKNATYQTDLANAAKSKGKVKVPASANPGPQPSAPDAANCAPAAAFGITPTAAPSTTPTTHPTSTASTARPSTTATPTSSAKATSTPQAAG
jgi:PPM family protein phosphatase